MMLPLCYICQHTCTRAEINVIQYRKEFQEEPILAITELKFEDSISPDLRNRRQPPGLEELAKPRNERRRGRSSRTCKLSQMTSEAGIDNELLLVIRFCKFEEEDFGGEVVYVGES